LPYLLQQIVPEMDSERAVDLYRQHHATVFIENTHLLRGARETLESLHRHGMKIAVCSNKLSTFTRQLIAALGLAPFVCGVLGPDHVPQPKPAPDMLLAALERLQVRPAEALYVGDMSVDVQTARAAGVQVWVVSTGSESLEQLRAAKPDRILDRLADLPGLIARP
jgi:HAD superfamily hydrolase (TIGR01662 family)